MSTPYPYQQKILDAVRPGTDQHLIARLPRQSGATFIGCQLVQDKRFTRPAIVVRNKTQQDLYRNRLSNDSIPVLQPEEVEGNTFDLIVTEGVHFTRGHIDRVVLPCLASMSGPLVQLFTYKPDEVVISSEEVRKDTSSTDKCSALYIWAAYWDSYRA
jgi:hypothetical protein